MANIIEVLRSLPDYIGSNERTEEEIERAEKALGISFAEDYREYLKVIGLACFDGHELTGLTKSTRLDVVAVTQEQRGQIGKAALLMYVVEETNIDGIIIWQSSDGTVYETAPNAKSKRIAKSLVEYFLR